MSKKVKPIIIDKENYTRSKKKLKTLLADRGITLSLSETSELLSKLFGFRNEHDLQKNYLEPLEVKEDDLDCLIVENDRDIAKVRFNFDEFFIKQSELLQLIKQESGLILVSGKTGAGKTTLINSIAKCSEKYSDNERITVYDAPIHFLISHDHYTLKNLQNKANKTDRFIFLKYWMNRKSDKNLARFIRFHCDLELIDDQIRLIITDLKTNKIYQN